MMSLFGLRPSYYSHIIHLRRCLSTSQLQKYYSLLNVTKDSSLKEIKESFLKLSKIYHPDNKVTGSHARFVELKEAYDAVKDGPPATDSSYSSTDRRYQSANSYANYDAHTNLRYKSERYYREMRHEQDRPYGFGGPYARSSNPWEDYMRDRAYQKSKQEHSYMPGFGAPLARVTIALTLLAWFVIYAGVMAAFDRPDKDRIDTIKQRIARYQSLDERRRREFLAERHQKRIKAEAERRNSIQKDLDEPELNRNEEELPDVGLPSNDLNNGKRLQY